MPGESGAEGVNKIHAVDLAQGEKTAERRWSHEACTVLDMRKWLGGANC